MWTSGFGRFRRIFAGMWPLPPNYEFDLLLFWYWLITMCAISEKWIDVEAFIFSYFKMPKLVSREFSKLNTVTNMDSENSQQTKGACSFGEAWWLGDIGIAFTFQTSLFWKMSMCRDLIILLSNTQKTKIGLVCILEVQRMGTLTFLMRMDGVERIS